MTDTNNGNAYAYGQSPDCGTTEQQQFMATLSQIFGELLTRDCANEQAISALDSETTTNLQALENRLTDLIETAVDSENFVAQVQQLQRLLDAFNLDADSDGRLDFLQPTLDRVENLVGEVATFRGFQTETEAELRRIRQIAEGARDISTSTAQAVSGLDSRLQSVTSAVANLPSLSQIRNEMDDRECSLKNEFWGSLSTGLESILSQVRAFQCQPSSDPENESDDEVPPVPTI